MSKLNLLMTSLLSFLYFLEINKILQDNLCSFWNFVITSSILYTCNEKAQSKPDESLILLVSFWLKTSNYITCNCVIACVSANSNKLLYLSQGNLIDESAGNKHCWNIPSLLVKRDKQHKKQGFLIGKLILGSIYICT